MDDNKIAISPDFFYSLTGEGYLAGTPAVFIRTRGCGGSCCFCDTVEVWKAGRFWSFLEILNHLKEKGWYEKLKKGFAHLVLTGGDPLLQQKKLIKFLDWLETEHNLYPYVEVETQAMVTPTAPFAKRVQQFNCSPKLANSGMSLGKRLNKEAMVLHAESKQSWFKFVITKPEDVEEAEETYITPFKISPQRVFLMPEGTEGEVLWEKSQWIADSCKEKGYRFTTRLQVLIWGQTTGV